MIDKTELLIYINELSHLIDEYKKCNNDLIKEMIEDNIRLLENAMITYYSKK